MKNLILLMLICFLVQTDAFAQAIIELEPSQSMSISGKGPGQDAVSNPCLNSSCFAVVENIGKNEFEIRIQKKGKVLNTILVAAGETKDIKLLEGQEMYLDSTLKATAKIEFQKYRY